ncbi:MAG: threonine ammonia-lyase [Bdellovibrionia bacterium]
MASRKKKSGFSISLADIQDAKQVIHRYLEPTPLLLNSWLSESLGCELYLKLENMQPIGSFKIRGAIYKISKLSPEEKKRGVIAASAGNHAQGVAWAARQLGVKALIVMPRGAPLVKIQNTRALGAEVELQGDSYDEAYEYAWKVAKKTGRVYVHAFEDPAIVAGQGTVGLEILEQLPDVDVVVSSIGGGGLLAGLSLVMHELHPQAYIIGGQASGASTMVRSLHQGRVCKPGRADTFADGIAVGKSSEKIFGVLKSRVHEALEADDEAIAAAVLTLLEKAKVVVEGAGALPLAVLDQVKKKIKGKKVVLVISGGNIDVNLISRIIDRGLIRAGRRLRINVLVSDRPGSLARLTDLIAKQGANILQAIHDRSEPSTTIDQTDVALTLETRGPEHSQAVIQAIREHVLRVELID